VRYDLEKKVAGQQKQLGVLASSRDSHLSHYNQLQHQCNTVMKQAEDVKDQIDTLEANGETYLYSYIYM